MKANSDAARGSFSDDALSIFEVREVFESLAATSGSKRKVEMVCELLRRASPLEAKYLVKLLAGDLRIGLKEGAVEDAVARAAGVEVAQVQWANMLLGDIGETALLARRERLETARMRLFHPLKFMLASPVADVNEVLKQMPLGFIVEDKFDGIRAQAHIGAHVAHDERLHGVQCDNRRVALFSRTLDEITRSFPDLIAPLAALLPIDDANKDAILEAPDSDSASQWEGLILDGEIVPVRGDVVLPFQDLQKRLGRKTLSDEMRAEIPVAFIAYDVLYASGRVLLDEPLAARRGVLESLRFESEKRTQAYARRADSRQMADVGLLDDEFGAARARGNEGLMIKDPRARYKPGRRGRDWLKIKRALATLDVVVTSVEVGSGRRSRFLSDFTFAVRASEEDATLLNVGKAYSGLTDAEIDELTAWFRAHTMEEFAHGKVRVVEPLVVLEVTFDRVQVSPRHKSGYALRFPRIVRLRPDKPVSQIDTLESVRRLAEELAAEHQSESATDASATDASATDAADDGAV